MAPSIRIVLLFLALLAIVLLVVFGDRFSAGFKQRFLSVFPRFANQSITPTPPVMSPTPTVIPTGTPRPKPVVKGTDTGRYQQTQQIPATGPEISIAFALGGSFLTGYWIRRKTSDMT